MTVVEEEDMFPMTQPDAHPVKVRIGKPQKQLDPMERSESSTSLTPTARTAKARIITSDKDDKLFITQIEAHHKAKFSVRLSSVPMI